MGFDRTIAVGIADEVRTALADVFERHGLTAPAVSTKYGDGLQFTIKTSRQLLGDNGVNMASPEAVAFKRVARGLNMDPNALGKTFVVKGEVYAFAGYLPRNKRFPFSGRHVATGKLYKFTDSIKSKFPPAV